MTTTMASNTENASLNCEVNINLKKGNVLNMCGNSDFKDKFYVQLKDFYSSQSGTVKKPWTKDRVLEVIMLIKSGKVAMDSGVRRNPTQYYWCKKYDLINVDGEDYLILKKKNPEDHTIRIVPMEEYFDTLMEIHSEGGHGGRDKMMYAIKNKLYIQRKAIEIFVSLCPTCESKRNLPMKGIATKPIVSKNFNCKGQVDLIDLQSAADGDYKWILNYQDHATKFLQLRPLRSNQASEVAQQLLDIFLTFGAPYVLQSDNGLEFTTKIIEEVVKMWPDCKIVHGSSRHPQTQGSVKRSNQDIENMLRQWMRDNNSTNWSFGCKFVQYQKNASNHRIIGRSPYSTLFGCDPKSDLQNTNTPESLLQYIQAEEDLEHNIIEVETNEQAINNISEDIIPNYGDKNSPVLMPQSSIKMECYVENPTLHESTEDLSVDNDESLRSTTSPARRKKRKAKRRYSVDAPDPEPVFYDIQEDIQDNQQYKSEDRYDVFGKIVAMKLRDLPKTQRLLAEKVINETLFEAEMGILAPRMVSTYSSAQTTDMCRPSSSSRQDAPCIRIEMDELPVKKKEKM